MNSSPMRTFLGEYRASIFENAPTVGMLRRATAPVM
jgi:hypothetical protein